MSQLNLLLKQALQTFTCTRELFHQNLDILVKLMNKICLDDVRINPVLLSNVIWEKPNKAPATYVHIFEDLDITMGIFILKPGLLLPLHDHPEMHGLIKVIHGKVKITSYSLNTDSVEIFNNENGQAFSEPLTPIIAEKTSEITVDSSNACSILYPEHKNIHQVECINGPAAFMDILSPPYDTINEHGEMRRCNYYRVLAEVAPNIFKLQKTDSPSTFWTDSAPFIGKLFG
ncbi:2-aminoethanethiol dioxygenase [Coccinella septempunctata]|uniref:2-aminoethanethiol dioxygenase n=1 Tax=Coccinella septempunctata TaxID=41139 RepID=UPI001D08827B|nr:2-aminoethanethiol dioxygenase [Coccinella septempunctata]